jgi:hypothetical protein
MESEWVIRTIRNTVLEHNQNSDRYTAFYGREEAPQKPHLSFLLIVGEPGIVHVSGKSSNWGTKEWFQHVIIQSSKCRTRSTFHSDSPLSVIHAIFPAYFLQGCLPTQSMLSITQIPSPIPKTTVNANRQASERHLFLNCILVIISIITLLQLPINFCFFLEISCPFCPPRQFVPASYHPHPAPRQLVLASL